MYPGVEGRPQTPPLTIEKVVTATELQLLHRAIPKQPGVRINPVAVAGEIYQLKVLGANFTGGLPSVLEHHIAYEVPEGKIVITISTPDRNLNPFWNEVRRLKEEPAPDAS